MGISNREQETVNQNCSKDTSTDYLHDKNKEKVHNSKIAHHSFSLSVESKIQCIWQLLKYRLYHRANTFLNTFHNMYISVALRPHI